MIRRKGYPELYLGNTLRRTGTISPSKKAIALEVNVSNQAMFNEMVKAALAEFGKVDILANTAGGTASAGPLHQASEEKWQRDININFRGSMYCPKAVLPGMMQQKYGKIVNFSSVAGRSGRPYSTHYAAAKAAVINITKSAALALARYNINVNAVAPGLLPTPMWIQIDEERGHLFGSKPGEAMANFIEQNIPLKRAATAQDLAGAVAFLCSADADYITGQCLNVDGGIEMD